jgi:hypothetical protein
MGILNWLSGLIGEKPQGQSPKRNRQKEEADEEEEIEELVALDII